MLLEVRPVVTLGMGRMEIPTKRYARGVSVTVHVSFPDLGTLTKAYLAVTIHQAIQ